MCSRGKAAVISRFTFRNKSEESFGKLIVELVLWSNVNVRNQMRARKRNDTRFYRFREVFERIFSVYRADQCFEQKYVV